MIACGVPKRGLIAALKSRKPKISDSTRALAIQA